MKKLALTLIIGVALFTGGANAAALDVYPTNKTVQFGDDHFSHEDEQNIERYLSPAGGMMVAGACATGCCPSECTRCIPTCCADTRGIFDGGLNPCNVKHITSCKPSYWAGSGGFCTKSCA